MSRVAESHVQAGTPLRLPPPLTTDTVSSTVTMLHEYAERSPIPTSESLIKLWEEKGALFGALDCVHALETCAIATRLRADHFSVARSEMIPALLDKLSHGITTLSPSDLVSASLALETLRFPAPSLQKKMKKSFLT
jgi:hypothetical protein